MGDKKKMAVSPVIHRSTDAKSSDTAKRTNNSRANGKGFSDNHGSPLGEDLTATPRAENKTILIIESGEKIRRKMKNILEKEGYNTLRAPSVDEGLKKFEQSHDVISLVIFSANMGTKTGLDVLDSLLKINPDVITLIRTTSRERKEDNIGDYMARGSIRGIMTQKISKKKLIRKVSRIFTVMELQNRRNKEREAGLRATLEEFKRLREALGTIDGGGRSDNQLTFPAFTNIEEVSGEYIRDKNVRIALAYDKIADDYDSHMIYTNHFPKMVALDGDYYRLFGSTILDLGCGDGYLMRMWASTYLKEMVKIHPNYMVRYLGVDLSPGMISVARKKLDKLYDEIPSLKNHLFAAFEVADAARLSGLNLKETIIDSPKVETVLASYVMHWAVDKEAIARVVSKKLKEDGIYRSMEEERHVDGHGGISLHITESPVLPKALAEAVEKEATPWELSKVYDLFIKHGLMRLPAFSIKSSIGTIADSHEVHGSIFVKSKHDMGYVVKRLQALLNRREATIRKTKQEMGLVLPSVSDEKK